MLKFLGSLEELQDVFIRCAIPGEWHFHKKPLLQVPGRDRSHLELVAKDRDDQFSGA
jgi:hypothetical protein